MASDAINAARFARLPDGGSSAMTSGTGTDGTASDGAEEGGGVWNGVDDGWTCTCPWYGKHHGDRGPCKHVLAVQLVAAE